MGVARYLRVLGSCLYDIIGWLRGSAQTIFTSTSIGPQKRRCLRTSGSNCLPNSGELRTQSPRTSSKDLQEIKGENVCSFCGLPGDHWPKLAMGFMPPSG
jgi:hypothetical protein